MIDVHTHILPYIDDGAKDAVEALKMTECLKMQQVHTAICTPHFDPTRNSLDEFVKKRENALLSMNDSGIALISGSETFYHELLYQYSDLNQICISNTRYLLLELPYQSHWSDYVLEGIEKLMNLYLVIPVIAHIERYHFLWDNIKNIRHLMNLGCVMQINANTIIDKKQRKKALKFIKKGWIDVIGSDCHNTSQRPPNLKEAFEIIERKCGSSYSNKLQQNANAMIKGRLIRNGSASFILKGSE